MKKPRCLTIVLILSAAVMFTACGKITGVTGNPSDKSAKPQDNLAEIYRIALDSFMPLDEALNHDMKYIAIDGDTLKNIDKDGKNSIMDYFKKYNVDVMDASLEDLKEKGLFNKGRGIDGILLSISEIKVESDDRVMVEGSKYRSPLGAIGVECVIVYKDDKWQLENSKITWIS